MSLPHTAVPTVLRDDTIPGHTLFIFNSDPNQHTSADTVRKRSVTAHRFRQLLISRRDTDSTSHHISLMPVLTFIEESNYRTICRPQVFVRIKRSGGTNVESELCGRFLDAWRNTTSAKKTLDVRDNKDILSAIEVVEALTVLVSRGYVSTSTIADSHIMSDQAAFQDEWYGQERYKICKLPSSYALTDLSQPIGIAFDDNLKFVDHMYLVSEVDNDIVHVSRSVLYFGHTQDEEALYHSVITSKRLVTVTPAMSGIFACNADLNDPSIRAACIRAESSVSGDKNVGHRGPLRVPVDRLTETFYTLLNVYRHATVQALAQGPAARGTSAAMRVQLHPLNLLHLSTTSGTHRLWDSAEQYLRLPSRDVGISLWR